MHVIACQVSTAAATVPCEQECRSVLLPHAPTKEPIVGRLRRPQRQRGKGADWGAPATLGAWQRGCRALDRRLRCQLGGSTFDGLASSDRWAQGAGCRALKSRPWHRCRCCGVACEWQLRLPCDVDVARLGLGGCVAVVGVRSAGCWPCAKVRCWRLQRTTMAAVPISTVRDQD